MSRLNRRTLLTGAALLPVVSAVAGGARPAMADGHGMAPGQGTTPGAALYTAPLGSFRITALLDGMAPLGRGFFFGGAEVDQVLAAAGIGPDAVPAPVSAFLIQSADRTILIDAGMGQQETLGPGFGRLTAGLAAAGVAPEDVDMVVVTHAHPDHVGGLIRDGAPVFANAELAIGEVEAAFWTDAAIMAQAPAEAQPTFQFAQTVLAAYGDRITRIVDGAEAAPGLTMMLSPGHTPGHCVVRIDGGDRTASDDRRHAAFGRCAHRPTGCGLWLRFRSRAGCSLAPADLRHGSGRQDAGRGQPHPFPRLRTHPRRGSGLPLPARYLDVIAPSPGAVRSAPGSDLPNHPGIKKGSS